jgi:hypothetical protein
MGISFQHVTLWADRAKKGTSTLLEHPATMLPSSAETDAGLNTIFIEDNMHGDPAF